MRVRILPYNSYSRSARDLARGLGGLRIRLDGSRYRYRPGDLVINWGNGRIPDPGIPIINLPSAVRLASNKRSALHCLTNKGVASVEATTSILEASRWLTDGFPVVCRTRLQGHSGEGIILVDPGGELVEAPLYTKYLRKNAEYRVHILKGNVIDFQRKKKRRDFEGRDRRIRNYNKGWVFCREGVELPEDVEEVSKNAVEALGLDMGAVDVLVDMDGVARVLEVNTAPGLTGTTLERYVNEFNEQFISYS